MKICVKCKNKYPETSFNKCLRQKDGLYSYCKECANSYNKIYHIKNAEKYRNNSREWYKKFGLENKRKWRKDHKDELRDYRKEYSKKYYANEANKKKLQTRKKTRYAIISGDLIKKPCMVCGDKNSESHHKDYDRPLEIMWLCNKHHHEEHNRLKILSNKDKK